MAKLILAMNTSLDGYVDDAGGNLVMGPPSPQVFDFWTRHIRDLAGTIYGSRMYEVMRYWDDDQPGWTEPLHDFAVAWRRLPKWVVSRTLTSVGPNATLIRDDIEARVREVKSSHDGTITVAGPQLAGLMTQLGLMDEYHLILRPFVLGAGKPFFHDARPPLRLLSSDQLDDETLHLTYAPA